MHYSRSGIERLIAKSKYSVKYPGRDFAALMSRCYGQDAVEVRSSHGRVDLSATDFKKMYPEVELQAAIPSLMGAPQFTWLVTYAV